MTYDDIDTLIERIIAMPEEERRDLDPIASALGHYLRRERPPVMALPNRIIALACVDLLREWQRLELGRDGDQAQPLTQIELAETKRPGSTRPHLLPRCRQSSREHGPQWMGRLGMSTYYTVFLLDDEDIAFGHGSAFWKYFVTALMTKRGERWYNPDDAYTMRSIRVTQEDRDVLKELEKDGFYEATFILSILGGVDGSLVITRHPE